MRDLVLGLEAVLPTGEIWSSLKRPRKDNTGYDLRHLITGAEGTLGVVTAACLKLYPLPVSKAVAMAGLETSEAALKLLEIARREAGGGLEAFEIISRLGIELAVRHIPNSRDPLETPHTWYLLIETAGGAGDEAQGALERILTLAFEDGLIQDAAIAQSEGQAKAFWALRENQSAAQKCEGPAWKHDVAVPVSAIPEFIDKAGKVMQAFCPGVRIPAFGHVGDGNLHYDVLAAEGGDIAAHMALREQACERVDDVVVSLGGSISAEHGIGVMKVAEGLRFKDPVEIAAYRAIRASLDPKKIMNPRVLF
jgi:FAD/FMN-containing dehydrogenase